jgi:IclR family acetate operon transcriptional repressor
MEVIGPDDGPEAAAVPSESAALRLVLLLEVIADQHRPFTLGDLVEGSRLPKPTVHRMVQQFEAAGLLLRQSDGRRYATGIRLRRLAEDLLLNDTHHGARHAVLRNLVEELGESCNITALAGDEVVYLDRVETSEPLRFHLRPGSRVPCHATASGKILLAQMPPEQRRRLIGAVPLRAYTANTLVDPAALEAELERVRRDGFAIDNEEFLPGLICVAVQVPATRGRSNECVAVQAPVLRLTPDRALRLLPALQRAASALAAIAEAADDPGGVPQVAARPRSGVATPAARSAPDGAPASDTGGVDGVGTAAASRTGRQGA